MTDVHQLIDWIHSLRVMGEKSGLRNMEALMDALGHPERAFHTIHVAGTNGKGSVCTLLESALAANGYTTGLYTSPFLMQYNERIRIDNQPIDDETLFRLGMRVYDVVTELGRDGIRPTAFEVGTAICFLAFAEANVDVAVIEVGLGGRLDPTNIIQSDMAVIATIALDHMEILGDTLELIAREKAGIIKPGAPAILYPQPDSVEKVLLDVCHAQGAPVVRAAQIPLTHIVETRTGATFDIALGHLGNMHVRLMLPGAHQIENARLALAALDQLAALGFRLNADAVARGIAQARWPGRLEYVTPNLLLDGAHNPQGVQALVAYLKRFRGARRIRLLTAMMREKQPDICARLLAEVADDVIATQVDWPRALDCEVLAGYYRACGVRAVAIRPVADALDAFLRDKSDDTLWVVAGSLYLIGEARKVLCADMPGQSSTDTYVGV